MLHDGVPKQSKESMGETHFGELHLAAKVKPARDSLLVKLVVYVAGQVAGS